MNKLKKLIGKTAIAVVATGMLYGSTANAATNNKGSCPSGQFKCLVSPPYLAFHCCPDTCYDCSDPDRDGRYQCNCALPCIICHIFG